MNIYVLKLKNDKYYVGKSRCVIDRIIEHKNGTGAAWTKLYKVIDIIAVYRNCDPFDEDKLVKKYMLEYGIDNVRGGSYSQVIITDEQYTLLERELHHSQDRCLECGADNHYAKVCPLIKSKRKIICNRCKEIGHYYMYCPNTIEIEDTTLVIEKIHCKRCGKEGHPAIECLSKKHANGDLLACQICSVKGHSKKNCQKR